MELRIAPALPRLANVREMGKLSDAMASASLPHLHLACFANGCLRLHLDLSRAVREDLPLASEQGRR